MKKLIIAGFATLLAFSTLAAAEEEKKPNPEEIKQYLLQQFDKETAIITQVRNKEDEIRNQLKSCIQAAKAEADLKACFTAREEAVKKYRLEMEKTYLENQKKAISNEEKKVNEDLKKH